MCSWSSLCTSVRPLANCCSKWLVTTPPSPSVATPAGVSMLPTSIGLSSLSTHLSKASLPRMTETHFTAAVGLDITGRTVWGFIDMLLLFIVMSVCTISLQAFSAFQAWSSLRWMSLYQELHAPYSVEASCALAFLNFQPQFSQTLDWKAEPGRHWPWEWVKFLDTCMGE